MASKTTRRGGIQLRSKGRTTMARGRVCTSQSVLYISGMLTLLKVYLLLLIDAKILQFLDGLLPWSTNMYFGRESGVLDIKFIRGYILSSLIVIIISRQIYYSKNKQDLYLGPPDSKSTTLPLSLGHNTNEKTK